MSKRVIHIDSEETESLKLELVVSGHNEVDIFIACYLDDDCIDMIGGVWIQPVKDHGQVYCRECRENGSIVSFDTYKGLYNDHLSDTFKAISHIQTEKELWVYLSDRGTAVDVVRLDPDRKYGESGWRKIPVSSFTLPPLTGRGRKSRHKQAVHKLLEEVMK